MTSFNSINAGEVKIFTDDYEPEVLEMAKQIANSEFSKNQKIRIMPDTHIGKGCMIGFTSTVGSRVNPDFIGCDIGCTVSSVILENTHIDRKYFPVIEEGIRSIIPTGFHRNNASNLKWLYLTNKYMYPSYPLHSEEFEKYLYNFIFRTKVFIRHDGWLAGNDIDIEHPGWFEKWGKKFGLDSNDLLDTIGTVGGGNHFIELDENDKECAFTVHTGSRNVGKKVYDYWHEKASQKLYRFSNVDVIENAKHLYISSHNKLDRGFPDFLKLQLAKNASINYHPEGYLTEEETNQYMFDMMICQSWALANHHVIHERIGALVNKIIPDFYPSQKMIISSHNYIDFNHDIPILRKGAVSADKNEHVIIPFNMRDGIAFCKGKGNKDWNCSAPHGAGRKMSRKKAFETLSMNTFNNDMKDICTTTAVQGTLDEAPEAYKPKDEIVKLIKPTVDIVEFMHSVINIKSVD